MGDVHVIFHDLGIRTLADRDARVQAFAAATAQRLVNAMKAECPVGESTPPTRRWPAHRAGTLRSSIRATPMPDGTWHVGPHTDYAEYVIDGTRPHLIVSHGPWSLHAPSSRRNPGGRYFGRVVHHPGNRPDDFVRRALVRMRHVTVHL